MRNEIVRVIGTRLRKMQGLLNGRELALSNIAETHRRGLVRQLRQDIGGPQLPWWLRDWEMIRPDDFAWIAGLAVGPGEQPSAWEPWLRATYDGGRRDHREIVDQDPGLAELVRPIARPVRRRRAVAEMEEGAARLIEADLRARLFDSLTGDPAEAFYQFFLYAPLRNHHNMSELDVTKLPGWAALDDDQRRNALDIAEQYLRAGTENGAALLGTDKARPDALAALAAFVLLDGEGRVFGLSRDRWAFWAPAIVHGPYFHNVTEPLQRILGIAHHEVPEVVREATEREVLGQAEFGQFTLRRLTAFLDRADVPWLVRFIEDHTYDAATAAVAFARTLELDPATALRLLHATFEHITSGDTAMPTRARQLTVVALTAGYEPAWPMIRDALASDKDAARFVFLNVADDRSFDGAAFNESELIEMWEILRRLFPPADDPVEAGTHAVSPREAAGHLRNRLLTTLAERGTGEAVRSLQTLAERHPDDPAFGYLVAQARAAHGRADWTPLEPGQVSVILSSARRVLRNDEDLLDAVLGALHETQQALQAATPLATLLWNHAPRCAPQGDRACRPKTEDEVSDFLDYMISNRVSGAVVNREVQVARLQTSGIGQRADLLIQAQAAGNPDRVLRVLIEVKGCWNPEIVDALEQQLVGRYLARWSGSAGLFLVAWFDPAHGLKPGAWRSDPIRGDRNRLGADLDGRAERATLSAVRAVQALVLDCSMPSEAAAAT
ncbi:hypothetical protein ACPPVO_13740 [Dactylosporangium sp. McL0621]|uniref:hypothetical protein n=1 Tax=Dactylosporangium sp. McL0621 TaxID=3415678 RepID=UPI003CE9035C